MWLKNLSMAAFSTSWAFQATNLINSFWISLCIWNIHCRKTFLLAIWVPLNICKYTQGLWRFAFGTNKKHFCHVFLNIPMPVWINGTTLLARPQNPKHTRVVESRAFSLACAAAGNSGPNIWITIFEIEALIPNWISLSSTRSRPTLTHSQQHTAERPTPHT
jgi:hypothetical protein